MAEPDWVEIARRNARSVQTTIGWIFWDPGAVARFEHLGVPGPLGYIASRAAPLAPAGPDAVIAAFASISPIGIRAAFEVVAKCTTFEAMWTARDEAVREGLHTYAADIEPALERIGPRLWEIVEKLPTIGRVLFAAHLRMARPSDPVLSGWHAVNCLREWRGDTHWALVAAAGLTGIEASILHNAWLGYERDWLGRSRGSTSADLADAWASLRTRELVDGDNDEFDVNLAGLSLRQQLEDDTDRLTTMPWELLGIDEARAFAMAFEPPCQRLLARVDETAGPNYQPASRIRS